MSPTCKSWSLIITGGLEQTSPTNAIFFSIVETKSCWRIILTCYLKNWMQKDKDKWPFNHAWKRWTHSLMKWSISRPSVLCTSMAIKIKWCPSWNPLYLWILVMVLNFATSPFSQVMTLIAIVFRVGSVTTTSTTKTWSSWVM